MDSDEVRRSQMVLDGLGWCEMVEDGLRCRGGTQILA